MFTGERRQVCAETASSSCPRRAASRCRTCWPVPVRIRQRVDRAGVVEERVRVPRLRREAELVDDVLFAVGRVVDVDRVTDVLAERVEVRAAGRLFERDVVGDDRDRVRLVRADGTRTGPCCPPTGSSLISGASRWLEARAFSGSPLSRLRVRSRSRALPRGQAQACASGTAPFVWQRPICGAAPGGRRLFAAAAGTVRSAFAPVPGTVTARHDSVTKVCRRTCPVEPCPGSDPGRGLVRADGAWPQAGSRADQRSDTLSI